MKGLETFFVITMRYILNQHLKSKYLGQKKEEENKKEKKEAVKKKKWMQLKDRENSGIGNFEPWSPGFKFQL